MAARPTFIHELEQLHIELVKMGALVEQSIEKATEAFLTQKLRAGQRNRRQRPADQRH